MKRILHNNVLSSRNEIFIAARRFKELGLPPHFHNVKTWDLAQFIDLVLKYIKPNQPILDCGCMWSPVMAYLYHLGYKKLVGIDLLIDRQQKLKQRLLQSSCIHISPLKIIEFYYNPSFNRFRKIVSASPKGFINYIRQLQCIKLLKGDITSMPFEDNSFQAISCLSVIEHGVDVKSFILEAKRILKKNGLLYISTDFWCEKIDTQGIKPFGEEIGQTKIFTPKEINNQLISPLKSQGFYLPSEINLQCNEKIVQWMGMEYTFFSVAAFKA